MNKKFEVSLLVLYIISICVAGMAVLTNDNSLESFVDNSDDDAMKVMMLMQLR